MQGGLYSPADSSRGSLGQSQMRSMHKKMHSGEGGGGRNHQTHHYTQQEVSHQHQHQQQLQSGLMPLLLDMNHSATVQAANPRASQGASPVTAGNN